MSHPSRVRGLKPVDKGDECLLVVAPITGAWIETIDAGLYFVEFASHPSRVRGLKLITVIYL